MIDILLTALKCESGLHQFESRIRLGMQSGLDFQNTHTAVETETLMLQKRQHHFVISNKRNEKA